MMEAMAGDRSRDRFIKAISRHRTAMIAISGDALYNVQVEVTCRLLDVVDRVTDYGTACRIADAIAARYAGDEATAAALRAQLEQIKRQRYAPDRSGFAPVFELQSAARRYGRQIGTGGSGWLKGPLGGQAFYGFVAASYPEGRRIANRDSWRCHHAHDTEVAALGCALAEVARLSQGGERAPCGAGPSCQDDECKRDWARLSVAS